MRITRDLIPGLLLPLLMFVFVLGVDHAGGHGEDDRILIVDTDMGLDDLRALYALLVGQDGLSIHGLVTVEGSASLGKGTDNLIGLLEEMGRFGIDLYKGTASSDSAAPLWRNIANELGGVGFPPPRKIRCVERPFIRLKQLFASHHEMVHYLALGPLGNPAEIEGRFPETLGQIHTLWIPARFTSEAILKDWNLIWDPTSAEIVLKKAERIVMIDLNSIQVSDVRDFFLSLDETSLAGRRIHALMQKSAGQAPHLMLYDELAAAALIDPELIEIDEARWSMNAVDSEGIRLERNSAGNIYRARFKDVTQTLEVLKKSWNRGNADRASDTSSFAHHRDTGEDADRILLKSFHGHLGPYVVLGYRMGKLALGELGASGHFDLSAKVYSILTPPCSCLIDGIQLGSGCTLGKRNIEVHTSDGPAYAVFESRSKQQVTIKLKPSIPSEIKSLVEEKGVEPAAEIYMDRSLDSLFEISGKEE